MKSMIAASLVGISLACVPGAKAADVSKLDARVQAAHTVLHELMATPDKGIPLDIAAKAHCVAVVPGFKKGAFLVGGQYGQGVATCRTGTGWSAPVFIQLTGASFGLQAGGQSTDLVLVGVNARSLDDLLKDKVKLGGDIAALPAPWAGTRRPRLRSLQTLNSLPTPAAKVCSQVWISPATKYTRIRKIRAPITGKIFRTGRF